MLLCRSYNTQVHPNMICQGPGTPWPLDPSASIRRYGAPAPFSAPVPPARRQDPEPPPPPGELFTQRGGLNLIKVHCWGWDIQCMYVYIYIIVVYILWYSDLIINWIWEVPDCSQEWYSNVVSLGSFIILSHLQNPPCGIPELFQLDFLQDIVGAWIRFESQPKTNNWS